ncbi:hypothetical protein V5799_010144 [Amblyomma americanum]|uniref:Cation efflux protein cytoplasmic domain-containing protein n=1 Tax=Amblyomma americanum TaxID=6943 RepID=A0AAQ4F8F5_AMBAM
MFSVIVLVTTLAILREALNVLMEGIPHSIDYHQVKRLLLSVDGVARVHDLHIWALSLDKLAVSAHVVLGERRAPSHQAEACFPLPHVGNEQISVILRVTRYETPN